MLKIALAAASILFLAGAGPAPVVGAAPPQTAYMQTRLGDPWDGGGGTWDPTSNYEMCLRNFGCWKYPDGSFTCSQDWHFRVCADVS